MPGSSVLSAWRRERKPYSSSSPPLSSSAVPLSGMRRTWRVGEVIKANSGVACAHISSCRFGKTGRSPARCLRNVKTVGSIVFSLG